MQINYCGDPFVDVGLATLAAFAGKQHPRELTEVDLEAAADYMERSYFVQPLRSYLTICFPNSGYTQPAFFSQPDKQALYAERVLRAFRHETPTLDEVGVFLGLPAADVQFDVKGELPPGRIFREHVPLQTGQGVINFHPYGQEGLPISGLALQAIQALPLGCAKCEGKMLAVHSDNPEIIRYFARDFLEWNRKAVNLAQQSQSSKMPEREQRFRTLLIHTLFEALLQQSDAMQDERPFAVTAYHFSNFGQNAYVAMYHLPSQLVLYLQEMNSPEHERAWQRLVKRAWALPKLKRGESSPPADWQPDRNWLYEDLFRVAQEPAHYAPRFIRTHFLRQALGVVRTDPTDPRGAYTLQRESELVSWRLTTAFLRRILNMEADRIEAIRRLGDELAAYVGGENDRRLFQAIYQENRYDYLRNALIKANLAHVRRGHAPFLTMDDFIRVFEEGEELAYADWRLARDLLLIRMVEQLYDSGWLGVNRDAVVDVEEADE